MNQLNPSPRADGALRRRQMMALLAVELRRNLFSSRAISVYVMAALPVLLFLIVVIAHREPMELSRMPTRFAHVHHIFLLRLVVFMGCAVLFTNLFRLEVLDRSLHYYYLLPLRRELLVVGKYLTGVFGAAVLFCSSTLLSYLALHLGHDGDVIMNSVLSDFGIDTLLSYMAMTALACAAYGAVFLLAGILFKNPMIAVLVIWGWESINFLLPPLLKNLTVIHHLSSLSPVPLDLGPFAFVGDPPPPIVAVLALLAASLLMLAAGALRVRKMDIAYGVE